ncbi:MAG: hypothetical protein EOO07_36115, partial [Chitinophagaceae bacterium]
MRFVILILVFCCGLNAFAQKGYKLNVAWAENSKSISKSISFPKEEVKDSLAVYQVVNKVLSQLQFKGYLLAEITALRFQEKDVFVAIQPNQLYQWVKLSSGNLPSAIKQSVGFKERGYEQVSFDLQRLTTLFETLLRHYENNGYPFASINLDKITMEGNSISASIHAQPNQKFLFDTIQIVGSAQVAQKYLQSYLNTKSGTLYSENAASQIENRLRELPFLEVVKPAEIGFSNEKASVRVFVNKKNANQFDGIVGL